MKRRLSLSVVTAGCALAVALLVPACQRRVVSNNSASTIARVEDSDCWTYFWHRGAPLIVRCRSDGGCELTSIGGAGPDWRPRSNRRFGDRLRARPFTMVDGTTGHPSRVWKPPDVQPSPSGALLLWTHYSPRGEHLASVASLDGSIARTWSISKVAFVAWVGEGRVVELAMDLRSDQWVLAKLRFLAVDESVWREGVTTAPLAGILSIVATAGDTITVARLKADNVVALESLDMATGAVVSAPPTVQVPAGSHVLEVGRQQSGRIPMLVDPGESAPRTASIRRLLYLTSPQGGQPELVAEVPSERSPTGSSTLYDLPQTVTWVPKMNAIAYAQGHELRRLDVH